MLLLSFPFSVHLWKLKLKVTIMKKTYVVLLFLLLACSTGFSQSRKSVSILGDSYSTFEHYLQPDTNAVWYFHKPLNKNDVTSVSQTWWHRFLQEGGYRLCVNNSFSGSTICHTGYQKADYSDRSFVTRMDNLGCPDIILIFGGTNDSWAGVPLGEYQYQDWTKQDLYSFRPAMAYMLDYIRSRYPHVEVYFILNSDLKAEIDESVKAICRHYEVPCLELTGIDKQEGHPSIKGMEQICTQLKAFLAKNQLAVN